MNSNYSMPANNYNNNYVGQTQMAPMGMSPPNMPAPPRAERILVRADEDAYLEIRVILPNDKFPKINFGGRIVGSHGQTIKNLSKSNKCKLILNTPQKSDNDLSYDPVHDPPHLLIKTQGPLPECLRRMADVAEALAVRFEPEWRDPALSSENRGNINMVNNTGTNSANQVKNESSCPAADQLTKELEQSAATSTSVEGAEGDTELDNSQDLVNFSNGNMEESDRGSPGNAGQGQNQDQNQGQDQNQNQGQAQNAAPQNQRQHQNQNTRPAPYINNKPYQNQPHYVNNKRPTNNMNNNFPQNNHMGPVPHIRTGYQPGAGANQGNNQGNFAGNGGRKWQPNTVSNRPNFRDRSGPQEYAQGPTPNQPPPQQVQYQPYNQSRTQYSQTFSTPQQPHFRQPGGPVRYEQSFRPNHMPY